MNMIFPIHHDNDEEQFIGEEIGTENGNPNDLMEGLKRIKDRKIKTENNSLYKNIQNETKSLALYFEEMLKKFPSLFQNDLSSFKQVQNYLKSISIPNKCVCAGVIDMIPGWKCKDCSKYENSIYCLNCYLKTKEIHEGHNILYLYSSSGMCDCGDPDALYTFCPDHKGPYSEESQINEYIEKVFPAEILQNLKKFFDDLFYKFSKYLLLTEKCEYFINEILNKKFTNNEDEKDDIIFIKKNFCILFQNFIKFLFLISKDNLGMLHLIARYFLSNHFNKQKNEKTNGMDIDENSIKSENDKTNHSCIKYDGKNIKILYKKNDKEDEEHESSQMDLENDSQTEHICECPFLRLLLSNWRDDIKSEEMENEEFILSLSHDLRLRTSFTVVFFFLYNQMILNFNTDIIYNRNQFYVEDILVIIAKETNLFEESYEIFFKNLYEVLRDPESRLENGSYKEDVIKEFSKKTFVMVTDSQYFSKPRVKEFMLEKISIIKRIIDCFSLIHNEMELESIVPHPNFQNKGYFPELIQIELNLVEIMSAITLFTDWNKPNIIKEIFEYIKKTILSQLKYPVKELKSNEFSFHLSLYRCFGIFLNSFCFNYSLNNNCSINDSIEFIKNNFFESKEETQRFINKVLEEYIKMLGFILGTRNGYFKYYSRTDNFSWVYFHHLKSLKLDFSTIKYLLAISEESIDLDYILRISGIENSYSFFRETFIEDITEKNEEKKEIPPPPPLNPTQPNDNMNINRNRLIEIFNEPLVEQLMQDERIFRNPRLMNLLNDNYNDKKNEMSMNIMQWTSLLDLILTVIKNDSLNYWLLLNYYDETVSSKTRKYLFDNITKNKDFIEDLKNVLKERLVHLILAKGNLIDLEEIKQSIDFYMLVIFNKNDFNQILDELALSKMNEEKKIFYLKDSSFKYLDFNYYFSTYEKSDASKYILEFKKNEIKTYHSYFLPPNKLTFDFHLKGYERIILNKNNMNIIIKILEKLLSPNENSNLNQQNKEIISPIRNSFLPSIFNYLSIFGNINSKNFVKFKIENKLSICKICEILEQVIKKNQENEAESILDKNMIDYSTELITRLNSYQKIIKAIGGETELNELYKLNEYDFYLETYKKCEEFTKNENLEKNINNTNNNIIENNNEKNKDENKKQKTKGIKEKLRKKMLEKNSKLLNDIKNKEETEKSNENLDEKAKEKEESIIENVDNDDKTKEEIMCFFCRNLINLNSFENTNIYGKLGLLFSDYFYANSINSSVKREINKQKQNNNENENNNEDNKNELYNNIISGRNLKREKKKRIISCGHYFHQSCFLQGLKKVMGKDEFKCPLCEKIQNILIPPLARFFNTDIYLKGEKLSIIFDEKNLPEKLETSKSPTLFKDLVVYFIQKNLEDFFDDNKNIKNNGYFILIDSIYECFKGYINFLENIFYSEGTSFHKIQQIDIIQNIILSFRYLTKINYIDINQIINYIRFEVKKFSNCLLQSITVIDSYENMFFISSFEKLLISLSILLNYEEIKPLFKYLIYWFLPYFIYGKYLINLMAKYNYKSLFISNTNDIINNIKLMDYLSNNNEDILECFKFFLQKLLVLKLVSSYENKNDDIISHYNELTISQLLNILGLDELNQFLSGNEKEELNINVVELFEGLSKVFKPDELGFSILEENYSYTKTFDFLIKSTLEHEFKEYFIKPELLIQFSPIKFEIIFLHNNIFDWIISTQLKQCQFCKKPMKYNYICLTCGQKICHTKTCNLYRRHLESCTGFLSIYIDMDNMKLTLYYDKYLRPVNIYYLYINDAGIGPDKEEIGKEYYLNKEKIKILLRDFISLDIIATLNRD